MVRVVQEATAVVLAARARVPGTVASSTLGAIRKARGDLAGGQLPATKQCASLLTPLALVDAVQCHVFALLRQSYEREEHVELVSSQSSAFLPGL